MVLRLSPQILPVPWLPALPLGMPLTYPCTACGLDAQPHAPLGPLPTRPVFSGTPGTSGAYDSLARLRGACDLMVVTSRQHCIQEPTLEWLERHFPQVGVG